MRHALAERLRADGVAHVHGWVDDMPGLMHACHVLVQNAGGLTSLEALAGGLPVVSYRCIPGHGRTNAAALDEAGLAPWIREPDQLAPTLTELLHGPRGRARREAGLALHASGGGTILLHDSDCTSAPDSWRVTLAALPGVLDTCEAHGWQIGPLREHGVQTRWAKTTRFSV
ncbi:glycosyltransferase [Streptomyces sp. NBC_01340]|uniref:glycosyltransferase n=1 Tax=Streptomyces sp. NBC_01340 TaxID=2903830 RepID=UPI003DA5C1EB